MSSDKSNNISRRIAHYDYLARRNGWTKVRITTQNAVQRQRYKKQSKEDPESIIVLDCWPSTGTIGSYLKHPKQGKTQLFRFQCSDDIAAKVFENPRAHTGQGYQQNRKELQQQQDNNKRGRVSDDDEEGEEYELRGGKRRRVACQDGPKCRNFHCPYAHPPRCFYGERCWFQPNCWFDHTHGLCRYGSDCYRADCWFSHRNPQFYY